MRYSVIFETFSLNSIKQLKSIMTHKFLIYPCVVTKLFDPAAGIEIPH